MKYSCFFFDLDGTLTDPAQGICSSIQYALEKGGYSVGPLEQYFPWIGPPLLNSFETYAHVSESEALRLLGFYRERFSTVGLFENSVYPGIPELLSDLKAQGTRMVVATGKPTVFSERILEHFGLLRYFDMVSGISLSEAPLDKCGVISAGLQQLSIDDPSQCLMIGDRDQDAVGAALTGMDCAYVLYGYGSEKEAKTSGARYLVPTVDALRKLLLG